MIDLQGWFTYPRLYDEALRIIAERTSWGTAFPDGPRFVECGVWKGRSIFYLAKKAREYFKDNFKVLGYDTFDMPGEIPDEHAQMLPYYNDLSRRGITIWDQLCENVSILPSEIVQNLCITNADVCRAAMDFEGKAAFVFLDADHRRHATADAIRAWEDKAEILAGHDVEMRSVEEALIDTLGKEGVAWWRIPECNCWTNCAPLAHRINNKPRRVFLGLPTGANDMVAAGTMNGVLGVAHGRYDCKAKNQAGSLLPSTFNHLYCQALNDPKADVFVMLHSDIAPCQMDWLDTLLDLMYEYEADVISAVSPIKSQHGLTSTAVDTDHWRPRRLTMKEIQEIPPTFNTHDVRKRFSELDVETSQLLINTGMMAVNLHRPESQELFFEFHDRIVRIEQDDKIVFCPETAPEDWLFSRQCNELGLNVFATREIPLVHMGGVPFKNQGAWGTLVTDTRNDPKAVQEFRDLQLD